MGQQTKTLTALQLRKQPVNTDPNAYDAIFISHSGGKDSQAMFNFLVAMKNAGTLTAELFVVHADLRDMEWEPMHGWIDSITGEYEVNVVRSERDFWDECRKWGRIPGAARFCTSELKTRPINEFILRVSTKRGFKRVINATGIRHEESEKRGNDVEWQHSKMSGARDFNIYIADWKPIITWKVDDVFKNIADNGQKPHHIYAMGFSRLSCAFCVYGQVEEHKRMAQLRPALARKMANLERELGKTIRMKQSKGVKSRKFIDEYIEINDDGGPDHFITSPDTREIVQIQAEPQPEPKPQVEPEASNVVDCAPSEGESEPEQKPRPKTEDSVGEPPRKKRPKKSEIVEMEFDRVDPAVIQDALILVSYGAGLDSTAAIVELHNRGIRPDVIVFSDVGAEKPETYEYIDLFNEWLASVGFPQVTRVKYEPTRAPYETLEGKCLANETLPSLAYGQHSCSLVFKRDVITKFLKGHPMVQDAIASGRTILQIIGYDDSCADRQRRFKSDRTVASLKKSADEQIASGYALKYGEFGAHHFAPWYALQDWGLQRDRLAEIISAAGLPVPMKSSCWFCPAMKKDEIIWLKHNHPDLFKRALEIERNALNGRHHAGRTDGKKVTVKGLGRNFAWADLDADETLEVDSSTLRP